MGQFLKNPQAGLWSTTHRPEAEEMLKIAVEYTKAFKYKFLEGKLRVLEVASDFNPGVDPIPV